MEAVKENVAYLEKKLVIVEVTFDNEPAKVPSIDPMPEVPPAHEPQQQSFS